MKKIYTTLAMMFIAITASAQTDSIRVRIDFNENPWGLPVSIPNRDKGMLKENGKTYNWSVVDDETGIITDTYTFDRAVGNGKIQLVLTPANPKLSDYDNAMVMTHDLNEADEPIITMLWMRRGSQLAFKAPDDLWFAKVVFGEYRNWSSGSLYSSDLTDGHHVWGKDSVKTRITTAGGQEYILDCWSGDSVDWTLPECTGNTYLKYIDIWLLPRDAEAYAAGISEKRATLPRDEQLFDLQGRRSKATRRGIYVTGGKKVVF